MITIIIWIIVLAVLGLGLLLLVLFFPRLAGPGSIWLWVKYLGVIGGVPIAIGIYLAEWYYVASQPSLLWFLLLMLWHIVLTVLIWVRQKRPGSVRITAFMALWLGLGSLGLILQVVLVADDGSALGIATYVLALLGAIVLWWRIGPWLWGELKEKQVPAPSPLPRWNPEKGFSGQIFGDSANFIAVAAGIGSFNILSFNRGLWLLGLLSGFLALAVGLSLHYRWIAGMGPARGKKYGEDPADRWITISSALVGMTTILAGLVPKQETVGLIWPYVGWASASILTAVGVFWAWRCLRRFRTAVRIGILWLVITCMVLVVCLGVIIWFSVTSKVGEPPDGFKHVGNALGLLAILFWIVAELFNTWTVTDDFMKGNVPSLTSYLSWEKSVWQIIGALIFMVYSALIALDPTLQNEPIKALFYYGVGLAGIGTIRGIIGGIINQMGKPAPIPAPERSLAVVDLGRQPSRPTVEVLD
jgi:hypothetical protein